MRRPLDIARIAMVGLAPAMIALAVSSPVRSAPATAAPAAAATPSAESLYVRKCGFCHIGRNTGTLMLERRLGAGQGELARRTDLEADYVVAVARAGLMSMPAFSRVEATDEELRKIAAYLARGTKSQGAAR